MIVRRSKRSAAGPATADIRNAGNDWATYTRVTSSGESVRCCTRPTKATYANQSPANEMTWAMNKDLMSRLVRNIAHMRPLSRAMGRR